MAGLDATSGGGSSGAPTGGASGGGGASGASGAGGAPGLFDCSAPTGAFPKLKLTEIATGMSRPLIGESPLGDANRLMIGEQKGLIHVYTGGALLPTPFLDITTRVYQVGSEQGMLGLAFHPSYASNGRFYVHYSGNGMTAPQGDTVVSEFTVTSDPNVADSASEKVLLIVDQPQANHNGGAIHFREGSLLYIGLGDGGNPGDSGPGHAPGGNGQATTTLLGKLLRIDVDNLDVGKNYGIPAGNMLGSGVLPELWSYGLRNPYRWSFDPCTDDMYLADVGQNEREEVNIQPKSATSGLNYGWRVMEGTSCFNAATCDMSDKVLPVVEYTHTDGCSVIGGYAYRGSAISGLRGTYLYADFCSGRFWAFRWDGTAAQDQQELTADLNPGASIVQLTSFGQDGTGELYVMSLTYGKVYRIDSE